MCLFLGISFVVCVLPITLSFFDLKLYHDFSNVMITLNSLINPCVYFIKVYYDSRTITRSRSDTTHALLDTRDTAATETNEDSAHDHNENGYTV